MQTSTDSSGLITAAQSINLDANMDNFMLLTFLKPDQVGEIKTFLSEIMTHVEVIFTNTMPGKITGGMKIKILTWLYANILNGVCYRRNLVIINICVIS